VREAKTRRAQLVADIEAGKYGGQRGSLSALVDAYIDHRERSGAAPRTVGGYRSIAAAIAAGPLGRKRLDRLTTHDLDEWYADLIAGGMTPATLLHYHRLLSAALNQGERWGWNARNVARLAIVPRVPRPVVAVPTPARVVALIDFAAGSRAPDMAAIITTAALTGLRRGELCGLRWGDVDVESGTITVRRSIWQTGRQWGEKPPKSHQARTVHVGPRVLAGLDLVRRQQVDLARRAGVELVDDPFVFSPEPDGVIPKMPNVVTQGFGRFVAALEAKSVADALEAGRQPTDADRWPYRFHDLRHYSASELLAAGASMVTVSRRLGHAKVSTTSDIYAHDSDDQARAAAGMLDAGLEG
jgi:integrase